MSKHNKTPGMVTIIDGAKMTVILHSTWRGFRFTRYARRHGVWVMWVGFITILRAVNK